MKKNYKKYEIGLRYNKFLNKIIIVLAILIITLIIKTINNSTSNNVIEIIENNIYYNFTWEKDVRRVGEYVKKFMGNTIESIEIFNIDGKD